MSDTRRTQSSLGVERNLVAAKTKKSVVGKSPYQTAYFSLPTDMFFDCYVCSSASETTATEPDFSNQPSQITIRMPIAEPEHKTIVKQQSLTLASKPAKKLTRDRIN